MLESESLLQQREESMTDPRFPGTGNYLDWLMDLDVFDMTPTNVDELIAAIRKIRMAYDSGVKPKKNENIKPVDLAMIGLGSTTSFKKKGKW